MKVGRWSLLTMTESISPRQKSTPKTMANPVAPFRIIVLNIALGTFIAAFSISSDIWLASAKNINPGQKSYMNSSVCTCCTLSINRLILRMLDLPTKVATLPINPTQYESPCVGHPPSFKEVSKTLALDPCGERYNRSIRTATKPRTWNIRMRPSMIGSRPLTTVLMKTATVITAQHSRVPCHCCDA